MNHKLIYIGRLLSLYRLSEIRHWPRLSSYFAGVLVYRIFHIRLFQEITLPFRCCKVYGDVEGYSMMGLAFLAEIEILKPYDQFNTGRNSRITTLFDAGANCGFFSIPRCLENPSLRAVCFEPHPATFKVLTENIRLNGLEDRIIAVPKAVSDSSRKIDMNISDSSSMATIIQDGSERSSKIVTVDALSLDTYAQTSGIYPQAVKIDVEGCEIDVLNGSRKVLAGTHELVVEYHSKENMNACLEILKQEEFSTNQHDDLIFGRKTE